MGVEAVLIPALTKAAYIFIVGFVIGMIIFVHELGHFLACKKVGVRVEAFSLGFGPVLIGYKKGDTQYRLSLIPLGGYVKMAGEHVGDAKAGQPDEFQSRTVGERAFIVVAGVVTHVLFAFVIFIVAFRIGVPFTAAEVGDVVVGSPAWIEGVQSGDKIVEINGKRNVDYEELVCASALSGNRHVDLRIRRGEEEFDVRVEPQYDETTGTRRLGISPQSSTQVEKIYTYRTDDDEKPPAVEAGIKVGDIILRVGDADTATWQDLSRAIRSQPGKTLGLALERDGERIDTEVHVRPIDPRTRKVIGVMGATTTLRAVRKRTPAYDKVQLRPGDRIEAVDGTAVTSWMEFSTRLAAKEPVATVTVARGSTSADLSLAGMDQAARTAVLNDIIPTNGTTVTKVSSGSAAEEAGIRPGDRIVSVDGAPMETWRDILQTVAASDGAPMEMVLARDGKDLPPITVAAREMPGPAVGYIGIIPSQKTVIRKYGLGESCVVGCRKAVVNLQRVYMTLTGLVTKRVAFKNVGGIILIAQASYYSAMEGLGKLLYFTGVIAINLAFVNMLPIPLLDGGLLLFLLIEKVKGGPVSDGALRVAQYVGLALLLTLMVFVIKNDIVRLWEMYH